MNFSSERDAESCNSPHRQGYSHDFIVTARLRPLLDDGPFALEGFDAVHDSTLDKHRRITSVYNGLLAIEDNLGSPFNDGEILGMFLENPHGN